MEGLAEVVLLILAASAGAGGVAGYYVGGPKHRVLGTLGGAAAGVGANAQSPQQLAANAAIQGP